MNIIANNNLKMDPFHITRVLRSKSQVNLYSGERKPKQIGFLRSTSRYCFYDYPNKERLITVVRSEKDVKFSFIPSAVVLETLFSVI